MALNAFAALQATETRRPEPKQIGAELQLEPLAAPPAQFFSKLRVDASLVPEKRLMFAVLEEALVDYAKCCDGDRAACREVEQWIHEPGGAWPFSFERICEALGIESDYLRGGLEAWRTRKQGEAGRRGHSIRAPVRRLAGQRTRVTLGAVGVRDADFSAS